MASVGHGAIKEGQIINKLQDLYEKDHRKAIIEEQILQSLEDGIKREDDRKEKGKSGIVVKGVDDVAVRFSKCCSPVPGDEIVGFVTRGRGISIHRTDCVNVINMPEMDRARLIDAEWQEGFATGGSYVADICVYAHNRTGFLADVVRIFAEKDIDITNVASKVSKQNIATVELSFRVMNREELSNLIEKLRQINGVIDIERSTGS